MEKKNVVIYVAGQRFSLSTTDSEEYVIGIGEKVDVMIKGIQKDNPRLNRDACATLAALDLCDDESKLRQMLELLREQVKDYLRDSEELRTENEQLKAQVKELTEKLEKASACEVSAPAATSASVVSAPDSTDTKTTESAMEKSASETAPATPEQSTTRQTAFVGKNFQSDKKKKKKHEHNHQNPFQAKYSQQKAQQTQPETPVNSAPAVSAPVSEDNNMPEDLEFPDTPYQFNLFEDLM